jgi:hypothetical protein
VAIPKHKRPSALVIPHPEKKPIAALLDSGKLNPAWRINRLEMCDPFGWHELDGKTLDYIRGKLVHYESMTINEIFAQNQHYNHPVEVTKLCPAARQRLRVLRLEDLELLHRLRLSGPHRVWAIREANVLNLIWWDPNHLVCPSREN